MRTLLVEDHPPLADAISSGLERTGFAVDVVGSVAEAEEAAALAHYSLAVLDLGLPDGCGLDLLAKWQARNAFPTIILTARGALGDRIEGLDNGADDYIVKPIQARDLADRLLNRLRRYYTLFSARHLHGDAAW